MNTNCKPLKSNTLFRQEKKFSLVNLLNPQTDGEESNDSVLLVAEMA